MLLFFCATVFRTGRRVGKVYLVMALPKVELRRHLKSVLKQMTHKAKNKKSHQLVQQFLTSDLYRNSNKICTYLSIDNEPNTDELIQHALSSNRKVFVPYVIPQHLAHRYSADLGMVGMVMRRLSSLDDLIKWPRNSWGIKEPPPSSTSRGALLGDEACLAGGFALLVVPGLGFSREGGRIGRGGGFYDRYVQWYRKQSRSLKLEEVRLVSIAFEEQLIAGHLLQMEPHDIVVDQIFVA